VGAAGLARIAIFLGGGMDLKRWRAGGAVAVLLIAAGARGQTSGGVVPEALVSTQGERVWVGAGHVATLLEAPPKGDMRAAVPEMDWFFRDQSDLATLSLQRRFKPCVYYLSAQATHPADWGGYGFDSLFGDAPGLIDGRVIARRYGFYRGAPEALLLVRVDRWLMREGTPPEVEELYLRYAPTRFEIAGVPICRPELGFPAPPRVGDRILAAAGWPTRDQIKGDRQVLSPGYGVFFERKGRVFTSDLVAARTADWPRHGSLDEIAERATALLGLSAVSPAEVPATVPSPPERHTLLAFNLAGIGVATSSVYTEPVGFDIDGDGATDQTGWLIGGGTDAFLWIDSNRNGEVDGVGELSGSAGPVPGRPRDEGASGFASLALWDRLRFGGNADGRLDRRDRVWRRLRFWLDGNNDGVAQPNETARLGEHAVSSIDLGHRETDRTDGSGNRIVAVGRFWIRGPGGGLREQQIAEVAFKFE